MQSVQSITCPVCGPGMFRWLFQKKGRDFWRCESCGLGKQHPLPTVAELLAYYEQSFQDGLYKTFTSAVEMKAKTAARRLAEISRVMRPAGTWLDVGCANGAFVRAALDAGLRAEGVEISQSAVNEGRAAGLTLHHGELESLDPAKPFDNLSAFDVLEHVLDPQLFLTQMRDRLVRGGHLVLTLPNVSSWIAKCMGSRWYFYIPEEHLHYFRPRNLAKLVEQMGFGVVSIRRTYKPLTYAYGKTQFQEFNPWLGKLMEVLEPAIPRFCREAILPLYIGEMMLIGRRR